MKLAKAVRRHDDQDRQFIAAIHGATLEASHGQISNRRTSAMARAKQRRARGH